MTELESVTAMAVKRKPYIGCGMINPEYAIETTHFLQMISPWGFAEPEAVLLHNPG
ncbi:hypothetical protein ACM66Z_08860 [Sulfurovum sp. ST-21]|uniref:Uncharacterized protein n=1 Tax=Sulfurovum indicum TaxID=2779528 RepID=A0A7M1S286_9BACT|nr:hypothetical protein [Sulfurovum indicum]QOR61537.1 hypothetical protein IMZ28_08845 [Sulfurovum indicum]